MDIPLEKGRYELTIYNINEFTSVQNTFFSSLLHQTKRSEEEDYVFNVGRVKLHAKI